MPTRLLHMIQYGQLLMLSTIFCLCRNCLLVISQFLNSGVLEGGEQLKEQILDTNFLGLSGHVRLNAEKGEPLDSSYDIVNVIEGGCRVVGSWTKGEGLVLKQGVKWGGESGKVPRGWVKPVPGEKLKIGVPWERGFTELITIKPAHTATQNQTYDITGFCIDVFKAAVKRLEYELPHEFIPYGNGNVTEDYYDDLVYQVYLKKFDAVVGGVAVTTNRSKYVDFTQPYADAGLSMTVVMEDDGSSEPWAFLLPFTPAVWITTLAFFFFTGAVVWLLEHRRNSQFRRGSRRKQVLTFLWFSFSTAFKTHTEIVESALGKAVVIIWFFVVLVLVSSYTASLSSMVTVKQMIPAVENVESLISKKMPIGYRQGSYVGKYLEKQLGVDKSLLRAYSSVQEYAIALKKGPDHGGVAAIFESQFTQNIFLSTGCNAYAKVGPTYKSGGLAFVFPKGSPLVSDISKAILNLSESRQMQDILNNWLNTSESNKCKSKSGGVESNRLSLRNFRVIFVITGCVSLLTLLYFLCRLLYRFVHRNDNPSPSPSPSPSHAKSISTSLRMLANYADQKDIPPPKRKRSDITIWSDELAEAAASPSSEIST